MIESDEPEVVEEAEETKATNKENKLLYFLKTFI